ncbi:hypothetical protein GUITHDRAFT_135209 [Guillardia theta CCMP2712]|uniref:EamA domain-containing protein n=1 Tax=Guillardia theta (strain CCMP2712) TaxID=905079 RepID=L1JQ28_GUITC|nr:hypothetical protein GUITHDRAFT_135209 [Guillardia theta CCMP2712]EKX50572.1 hypothetical protein GUITHDRAFT_135209 [Guillardia theta CCMP2712]|eukprot:XP_005837552.1 hypothetical protein GUITHDRAFT_135209 [Guillardia theta CCMP2712]
MLARLFALGFLGSLGGFLLFIGLSCLPASEAMALYATSPFWAMLIDWLNLRDRVKKVSLAALVCCFLGICFLAQQPSPTSDAAGEELVVSRGEAALLTLASALLVGFIAPTIRSIAADISAPSLVFWLGLPGILFLLLLQLVLNEKVELLLSFTTQVLLGPRVSWQLIFMSHFDGCQEACLVIVVVSSFSSQLTLSRSSWQRENSAVVIMLHMSLLVSFQWIYEELNYKAQAGPEQKLGLMLILLANATLVAERLSSPLESLPPSDPSQRPLLEDACEGEYEDVESL